MAKILNWAADDQVGFVNNDPVATMTPDLGATNLVQPTSTYQPLYKTAQLNGLPGILMDGVDDQLQCSITPVLTISRYVVYNYLGAGSGDGGAPRLWDGYGYGLYINRSTGQIVFRDWRSSINGDFRTPSGLVTGAMGLEVDVHYDRTVDTNIPEIWVNGVQQPITVVTAPSGIKTSDAAFIVGNNSTNAPSHTRSIHAVLCELGLSNTKDSLSVAAAERSRLLTKWGLSAANHFQQSVGGTVGLAGELPILQVSIIPPQGSLGLSGELSATRFTPAATQLAGGTASLSGTVIKRVRKKIAGSFGLSSLIAAGLAVSRATAMDGEIAMSGELKAVVVTRRESDCAECTKRNLIRQRRHGRRCA